MSILYKARKMVCTTPGKEKTGYFAAKVAGGTIDLNQLCENISEKCSMTGADVKGVMEALIKELELELTYGKNIRFGELGIFSASVTSDIVEKEEDLKPHLVRVKTITFLPSSRLKQLIKQKTTFMRLRDFNRQYNGTDEE